MKQYFVIGNPIKHSLSPKLHNYWLKKHKIKAHYDKVKLNENDLENIVSQIRNEKVNGINVTVPFKKKIIPFVDKLTLVAQKANSVNTIYKKKNHVIGDNTDIRGFEKSLKAVNFDPKNKEAFIIGTGGVSLSIIVALKKMKISKINITNRTSSGPNYLKKKYPDLHIIDWGKKSKFDIIINATSLGLNKDDKIPIILNNKKDKLFYDVIYNPKRTNFLLEGQKHGNKIENGMRMFIYQAQLSFKIWHKLMPKVDDEVIRFLEND